MSPDSIEDKALDIIKSHSGGILQSELWKDLNIDSRKCSRVIAKLEAEGKIKRTWETIKGTRTYRISYLQQKKEAPKKEVNFDLILAGESVAPCIGCTYECEPDYCPDLGNWIALLIRTPAPAPRKAEKAPAVKAEEEPEEAARAEAPAPKAKKPVKSAKSAAEEKPSKAVKAPAPAKAAASVKEAPKAKSSKPAKEESKKPLKAAKTSKKSKK